MSDQESGKNASEDDGGVEEAEKATKAETGDEAKAGDNNAADNGGDSGDVEGASKGTDWKSEARKWEQRAKANLVDLEALRSESGGLGETISGLRAENEELKAKMAGFEADNLRRDIVEEYNLPSKAAAFLSGNSREDMVASAESLRALIGHSGPNVGRLAGNPPANNTQYREGADFVDALVNSRR